MITMSKNTQTVRKFGFSNYIAVTGFAEVGEKYKIERVDENTIKLTKV